MNRQVSHAANLGAVSTPSPYEPAQPADTALVASRRPQMRTTLLWVAVVVVLVGSAF